MINRASPYISGLPKQHHQNLISFLQSQPDFKTLQIEMHHNSADGGQTYRAGAISASMSVSHFHCIYHYQDYLVTVDAVLGEIYIVCEKVTQEALFNKYEELKEAIKEFRKIYDNFKVDSQMAVVNERFVMHRKFMERLKDNKRKIKQKLIELGIEVKPGSELSRLLRLDDNLNSF